MTDMQRNYLIRATVFAVLYDAIWLLVGITLGAYAHSMASSTTFKLTFMIGLPSITQLLDPQHQINFTFNFANPMFLFWLVITTILFAWANGFFISLLSRSIRDRSDSSLQNANRAFPKLFLWMLIQLLVSALCMPLMALGFFGGAVAMMLLLWFRYVFMFFEYTTVVLDKGVIETLDLSRALRRQVNDEAIRYFWGIVLFNAGVAFLVNFMFSVPAVMVFLLLNSIIMTLTQHNLLRILIKASDQSDV